ncbi:hypothetical protein ABK040_015612 [Willaertia magna]
MLSERDDKNVKVFGNKKKIRNIYLESIANQLLELEEENITLIGRYHSLILINYKLILPYGKCYEKIGKRKEANRCFIIYRHLFPNNLQGLESLQNNLMEGGLLDEKSNNELLYQQFQLNPLDFELRLHFVKRCLDKKRNDFAFRLALDYFVNKLIKKKINTEENEEMSNYNKEQTIQEFKTMMEIFEHYHLLDYSIRLNELAIQFYPTFDSNIYYHLYENYLKKEEYINAFRAYSQYMYLTGSISIDHYKIIGECLEKAGEYHFALFAYWQCHLLQQQELQMYNNKKEEVEGENEEEKGEKIIKMVSSY